MNSHFPGRAFRLAALAILLSSLCAHAAIKSKDDEADFALSGEIPVKNWAKLMEETNTPPIVIPPTSKTSADVEAKAWAWLQAKLLQPALLGYVAADDELMRAFWMKVARLAMETSSAEPELPLIETLTKLTPDPALPPGLCFIAGQVLSRTVATEGQGLALLQRVVDAPEATPMPALARAEAQARLLFDESRHPERRKMKPVEEKFYRVLRESLAKPLPPDDLEQATGILFQSWISQMQRGREAKYLAIYQESALPEWLRLTATGQVERNWAYTMEKADSPDEAKIKQHLEASRELLTHAWALNPGSVYPAHQMMALVQHENQFAGRQFDPKAQDKLRLWFDRAIGAQCDWMPLYGSALNGYSPSYGGNLPKMLAFGRACAETRRFDTDVPVFFSEALSRIADTLPDWRTLYLQPGLSKLLLETGRARVAKLEGDPAQAAARIHLAFDAWACAEYAVAAEHFRKLARPDGTIPSVKLGMAQAVRWQVDLGFVQGDSFCRGGAEHEAFVEAGRLLADELPTKAGEAERIYRKLLARAEPAARPLLQANVRLAEFRQIFAKGQWAPMPLDEAQCWRQVWGAATWQPETKRLRLSAPTRFSKALFRGRLGPRFEMRGHFYNSHGVDRQAGGLGILCGHTPMGAGGGFGLQKWWTTRVDNVGKTLNSVDWGLTFGGHAGKEGKEIPWQADNTFVYRYENGKVTFSVNGQEFLHEVALSDPDSFTGSGAVGFGMLGQGSGAVTEVWEVEARKLFNAL